MQAFSNDIFMWLLKLSTLYTSNVDNILRNSLWKVEPSFKLVTL